MARQKAPMIQNDTIRYLSIIGMRNAQRSVEIALGALGKGKRDEVVLAQLSLNVAMTAHSTSHKVLQTVEAGERTVLDIRT